MKAMETALADLSQAHELKTACDELVRRATAAVDRAAELVERSKQALKQFADVDGAITDAHATAVKAWAVKGGERPNLQITGSLAERKEAKARAECDLEAATSAYASLIRDLTDAKERQAGALGHISRAAEAILTVEAEALTEELEKIWPRVLTVRDALKGLAHLWLDHKNGPMRIPPRALKLILLEQPQELPLQPRYGVMRQRWKDRFETLLKNDESAAVEFKW